MRNPQETEFTFSRCWTQESVSKIRLDFLRKAFLTLFGNFPNSKPVHNAKWCRFFFTPCDSGCVGKEINNVGKPKLFW